MKTCTIPTTKSVKAFANYDFDNSDVPAQYEGDYPHVNFFKKYFLPIVRKELKAMAKRIGATLTFNGGHFYWSAFFSKNGKHVYASAQDFRWDDWYNQMLYRTAESTKDYTGGTNRWCGYEQLEEAVSELLNR